jgi:hypothetical protein
MVYPNSIYGNHIVTGFVTLEMREGKQKTELFSEMSEPQYIGAPKGAQDASG